MHGTGSKHMTADKNSRLLSGKAWRRVFVNYVKNDLMK